jgi:hypothetical protein
MPIFDVRVFKDGKVVRIGNKVTAGDHAGALGQCGVTGTLHLEGGPEELVARVRQIKVSAGPWVDYFRPRKGVRDFVRDSAGKTGLKQANRARAKSTKTAR